MKSDCCRAEVIKCNPPVTFPAYCSRCRGYCNPFEPAAPEGKSWRDYCGMCDSYDCGHLGEFGHVFARGEQPAEPEGEKMVEERLGGELRLEQEHPGRWPCGEPFATLLDTKELVIDRTAEVCVTYGEVEQARDKILQLERENAELRKSRDWWMDKAENREAEKQKLEARVEKAMAKVKELEDK